MTGNHSCLDGILDQLESGRQITPQDIKALSAAVSNNQIRIEPGNRSVSIGGNADGAVIVTGDRNIVVTGDSAHTLKQLLSRRPSAETGLLTAVQAEVTLRLEQSLHGAKLLRPGMESRPDLIERQWEADVKIGPIPTEDIPAGQSILEVFHDAQNKLLILGHAGSGKTTLMLDLASSLCQSAHEKSQAAIPVLLNLSSFRRNRQSLLEWLALELKSKYGLKKEIAASGLESHKFALLLDGLDELGSSLQEACVEEINELMCSDFRPPSLLVCSRPNEYSKYTAQLALNDAVILKDITDEQLKNYLIDLNEIRLLESIENDESLNVLLHNPFFLSIAVLSREALFDLANDRKVETTAQRLLSVYVKRMLERKLRHTVYEKATPPAVGETKYWLKQIAKILEQESQTEFLIERLQPYHIKTKEGIQIYMGSVLSINLINGNLLSSKTIAKLRTQFGYTQRWTLSLDWLREFNWISSVVASAVELTHFLIQIYREPDKERLSQKVEEITEIEVFAREFIDELAFRDTLKLSLQKNRVFFSTLIVAIVAMAVYSWLKSEGMVELGISTAVVFSFLFGLVLSTRIHLKIRYETSDIEDRRSPNYSLKRMISNLGKVALLDLMFWFAVAFLVVLPLAFIEATVEPMQVVIAVVMFMLLGSVVRVYKLLASQTYRPIVQHVLLQKILQREKTIPKNLELFLEYCTQRLLLQRVGGRYRFAHKMLQEHFLAANTEAIEPI